MISVPVTEHSQVAEARRHAAATATGLGFGEAAVGRVGLVATEMSTNLVKYGTRGEILVGSFEDASGTGVELIALDRGEGLASIPDAMRDGYSTGGSPGTGLGAIRRASQVFDIASWPQRGTVVLSRLLRKETGVSSAAPGDFGVVTVPLRGETANGDAYCFRRHPDGWTLIVADGLGHGLKAAEASDCAIRTFRQHEDERPSAILAAVHLALRPTRGGAVSVARYDAGIGIVTYCGIGNVAGTVVAGGVTRGTVSLPGTAGHAARRVQEFEYPLAPGSLFLMYSDGIGSGWTPSDYPGILAAHPALIAAIIYRDLARARDDATVAVVLAGT